MRIISKFNDYYDNIVGFYVNDRVWERKTSEIQLHFKMHYLSRMKDIKPNGLSQRSNDLLRRVINDLPELREKGVNRSEERMYIIGFCGKLYFAIISDLGDGRYNAFSDYKMYMNIRELHKAGPLRIKTWRSEFTFDEKGLKGWCDMYHTFLELENIFIEMKSPVFIIDVKRNGKVEINPCMKDYRLQSVFNPYTAYQEIDMFLGNELAMCNEKIPDFGDELKRDAHGMDDWSFKQYGPKKRKRKKK